MRLALAALALASTTLSCSREAGSHAKAATKISAGPLRLGVTTHFGQGWPLAYWTTLGQLPAAIVRDGLVWSKIETKPGTYTFTAENSGHIDRLCQMDRRVLVFLQPFHPAYDGGQTAYTPAARTAFANFVAAVANRFPGCVEAAEIGNEINGHNLKGEVARDIPSYYTAILQAVYATVKPQQPSFQILGGSSNTIATGFLDSLFAAGALDYMDGVVVHPYRKNPANIDWELDRLRAAMIARGQEKPIWATEFSDDDPNPVQAADSLAKMATLMNASGVRDAIWYALAEQVWFPNMGLYTKAGVAKPSATSFAYFANDVLPRGNANRLNAGESDINHFRFGPDRQILWGARRTFTVAGNAVYRDSTGAVIAKPAFVTDRPIIIEGPAYARLGPRNVLADSLDNYGRAPWTYFGQRGDEAAKPLEPIDWRWTSFIGHPNLKPAAVNALRLSLGGKAPRAISLTLRYTADSAGQVFASGCFARVKPRRYGISFDLRRNGVTVQQAEIGDAKVSMNVPIRVAIGDTIDFVFSPNGQAVGGLIDYRARLARDATDAAPC